MTHELFEKLLVARGLSDPRARAAFLTPDYELLRHDPFLLPDMRLAVERIKQARDKQERVVIYGDYDIDGLTATSVLLEAFAAFGITADAFIPNRFVEGYGLNSHAIRSLAEAKADLIVSVDCGSLSFDEIALANELHVDVIVTDHHSVAATMPAAAAVINPKRLDHQYPFIDLAGVGVAFKLVQALQTVMDGLPLGQEKWLLDLVAFGTVCDVVTLVDENRANVHWGLQVMKKTRRPGMKALMAVSGVGPDTVNTRALGFGLGPRLNAAGRLETARLGLDLLTTKDPKLALELAQRLDQLNRDRRAEQDRIFQEALVQAKQFADDPVLVLSAPDWSHGIIGIVAAKILEAEKKPTFVIQELGEEAKGSARAYGDFSAVEAINASRHHLIKGGGHTFAAGVTLRTDKIADFRASVNEFYRLQKFTDQLQHLDPKADVIVELTGHLNEELLQRLEQLEPFGHGNPSPIFQLNQVTVIQRREMGDAKQHLKLQCSDSAGNYFSVIAFNKAAEIRAKPGDIADVWIELTLNEWQGRRTVEGRLLKLVLPG
ncbi:MAG TPA: single-stranded-DNA-specific exonuclease RecJ [Candidatus Saccharimonadales bacterium]|jgi:single-stranded-DNA-specific exonuclease|nr:single-stranded-DNA-specific exonuclease RecJ [Candidatus Saccharimonadales bacterium]